MKREGEGEGVFDEIAKLGEQYGLTTHRFMEHIQSLPLGQRVSRETLMRSLIGDSYDQLDEGKRNMIWTMLVQPDLKTALEEGMLKSVEGEEYERIGQGAGSD